MKGRRLTAGEIVLSVILVLSLIGLCVIGILFFANLTNSNDTANNPPTETPTPATAAGMCLKNGRLVVGTSADYPPFETFTNTFTLDGFDIALMKEIGTRMGVPVEFHNIAFEGLIGAIQLDQINAAISAISVTSQRSEQIAFSNVYYIGSDGILASVSSNIGPITSVQQIASQLVGVQTGSVYQNWVQTNLIDTGMMPAGNLYSYPTIDLAVNDLITGKIGLVLLDSGPAMKFANQGSAKLVGEGFTQQNYAIGFRQDCLALKDTVNLVLTQLQNDGTLARLAEQYLNLQPDDLEPVPTPAPPTPIPTLQTTSPPPVIPTATPGGGCIDNMAFVKDLNYPHYNMTAPAVIPAGSPFQKGWRILNTGTCSWNYQYYLGYAGGNSPYSQMGGQPTPIIGVVPPGATYDMYINLVAPAVPGIYQGFWQMYNPRAIPFGERVSVGIQVPPPNPATPTSAPDIPQIYRFVVNPTQIQLGQCVQLSWQVNGNVTGVNVFRNGNAIWVNGPSVGTLPDCPPQAGNINYEIQANGPGGTARADQTITVYQAPPPTATIPPQPPPVITAFDVQPTQIDLGACVSLTWQVNGTVSSVRLLRNGQVILDNAQNLGGASDCPTNPGSMVYRLEASGAGQTTASERAVTVNQAPQPPPIVGINWLLSTYSDRQGGMIPVIPGSMTNAMFGQDGSVQGNAGCNTYSGRYTATGNSITIVVDLTTLMTCSDPPGIMDQENAYLSLLQSARSFQVSGNQLVLLGSNNDPILVFGMGATPK